MTILKTIKLLGLAALLTFGAAVSHVAVAQPGVTVPVESFYDELSPYGQWMQHPGYGNVWLPNAGPDFQPYASGGHWVVTEFGNTWVSDYAWGWAPFHYGRWIYDPAYGGWLWIPGSDWGPAWVSWRSGGGYYGWAPLGPGWDINVNINIPAPYWTFVPQVYITSPRLYSYCVPRPHVTNIYYNTTIINNYYRTNNRAYVYGPPRGDIERVTRRSVPVYRVDQMDRPGRSVVGNGSVGFYRPGSATAYNRDYGRNDRSNNVPRSSFDGNSVYNRGGYGDNNGSGRAYDRSSISPNRTYSRDGSSRTYGQPFSGESNSTRDGNLNSNVTPDAGNSPTPVPNRFESNRGQFSRGNFPQNDNSSRQIEPGNNSPRSFQQGGFSRNRSFERSESQPQMNSQPSQSMSGGRSEAIQQRTQEGQGQGQRFQQRSQDQGQRSGEGFNPGGRRGPR
ncbi:hypothetical protein GCM10028807_25670 [Spirosoma daeguense]